MKENRHVGCLAALAGLIFMPSVTNACTFPGRPYSKQEIGQMAEKAFASATTVIDGQVISPMAPGPLPDGALPIAWIKVLRTWKGKVPYGVAPVVYLGSCDVRLDVKGQKVRILLNGIGVFTADQETNGFAAVHQSADFNQEIDRLVGATRPTDFTDAGGPPPPENK